MEQSFEKVIERMGKLYQKMETFEQSIQEIIKMVAIFVTKINFWKPNEDQDASQETSNNEDRALSGARFYCWYFQCEVYEENDEDGDNGQLLKFLASIMGVDR